MMMMIIIIIIISSSSSKSSDAYYNQLFYSYYRTIQHKIYKIWPSKNKKNTKKQFTLKKISQWNRQIISELK